MARDRRPRDDDEDEDDRPRRKRRSVDDDDEESRPKTRRAVDEDDEAEPSRRKEYRKPSPGMSTGLLIGLIGSGVVIVGGVLLLFGLLGGNSPKSAFNDILANSKNRRFDRVWDGLSKSSQDGFSAQLQLLDPEKAISKNPRYVGIAELGRGVQLEAFGAEDDAEVHEKTQLVSGKEAFIKVMNSAAAKGGALNQYPVVIKEEISGNTAILTVETTGKNSVKSINTHRMVKEGGRWKWDITGK